jgi:hypothetical protein
MSLSAVVFAFVASPSAATVTELPLNSAPKGYDFSVFRPTGLILGYELTSARVYKLAQGGKAVVRMTYFNKASRNQFDLIQTKSQGSAAGSHIRGLVKEGHLELELLPESTFVSLRRGTTDVGFVGTLVSGPSAERVLKDMKVWRD